MKYLVSYMTTNDSGLARSMVIERDKEISLNDFNDIKHQIVKNFYIPEKDKEECVRKTTILAFSMLQEDVEGVFVKRKKIRYI